MAIKQVPVCDRCGSDVKVQTFTIRYPDGTPWDTDLCVTHAKPLVELRDRGWGAIPSRRGKRHTFQVTSLADLARQERV